MKRSFFILALCFILSAFSLCVFASDEQASGVVPISAPLSSEKENEEELNSVNSLIAPTDLQDKSNTLLSPALSIIAEDFGMAKAGLVGDTLVFAHDDFCRALNLSSVEYITVLSLPDSSYGRLLLGSTVVTAGQKISRANLDLLVFSPASKTSSQTSFDFSVADLGYTLSCSVFMLDKINQSPSVISAAGLSDKADLHTNTPFYSSLNAYDPEGDTLRFEILKYPQNGLLILNDCETGTYTYFPKGGFYGEDEFTYVVRDIYGNYSASASVSLKIKKPSSSVVYSDMNNNAAYNAALTLAENDILLGKEANGTWLFSPDETLTRSEFVTMAMRACGISDLPSPDENMFYDASSIPEEHKAYIAAAKHLGYIEGKVDANNNIWFQPSRKITRSEAALIVDRIINTASLLGVKDTSVSFNDEDSIPSGASEALKNLNLIGLLSDKNGNIDPHGTLSREDAALLLCAIMKLN